MAAGAPTAPAASVAKATATDDEQPPDEPAICTHKQPTEDAPAASAELVDAIQTNDPDQVRQLLARTTVSGINAPSPRHHGMTPLSLAANNGALHVAASATRRGLVWRPGCRCI